MPALATLQDDLPRLRAAVAKALRFTSLIAFPTFVGLSVMAHEAIAVVLGEQWAESAPVVRVMAGNRDEAEFENADVFDVDRRPKRSLSYGHGIHKCIGEHLQRQTGQDA